jgi:hypothetical protein
MFVNNSQKMFYNIDLSGSAVPVLTKGPFTSAQFTVVSLPKMPASISKAVLPLAPWKT